MGLVRDLNFLDIVRKTVLAKGLQFLLGPMADK